MDCSPYLKKFMDIADTLEEEVVWIRLRSPRIEFHGNNRWVIEKMHAEYPLCMQYFDIECHVDAYTRKITLLISLTPQLSGVVDLCQLDKSEEYLRERLEEQAAICEMVAGLPQPIAEEVVACLRA
jgi:hypothetical protein